MSKRGNETYNIKDLMKEMLQENKLQTGLDKIDVKEAWESVMGRGVVSYTDSVQLNKNVLTVYLTSSALREELSYGKDKIIKMMNAELGKALIKNIKLL